MTVASLLAYICLALLLQFAAGLGVWLWMRPRPAAALVAAPQADRAAGEQGAWKGWRDFRVARRVFEDSGHTQCSFYLEPVDGVALPAFKPGQFLTFSLPLGEVAGTEAGNAGEVIRCYSLSGFPETRTYRITVKRVLAPPDRKDLPPGRASSHLHDHVHEGDILRLKAPAGHFCIDGETGIPAVLIGAGIGITPMMSMAAWCLAEQPGRPLHFYYGLRNGGEHAFRQQIELLAGAHPQLHMNVVYSRPGPDDLPQRDFQHTGHIDIALLKRSLPHGRCQFYVCGPAPMMASLVPALAEWGVPQADIHFEAFGPATVRLPGTPESLSSAVLEGPLDVRFTRTGRTLAWQGQDRSLLDFAERQGVALESGCRSGGCGSCEVRLVSGKVRYDHRPDYDIAPGHCLLCVGIPDSALVLEA